MTAQHPAFRCESTLQGHFADCRRDLSLFQSRRLVEIPLWVLPGRHGGLGSLCGSHLVDGRDFLPQSGMRVLRTKRPLLQLLRALCLLGTSLFFTTGLLFIPLAEATAVNFLPPVLVTALSVPLLGEHVTRGQWLAVICGFIGVLIIVIPAASCSRRRCCCRSARRCFSAFISCSRASSVSSTARRPATSSPACAIPW